MDVSLHPLNVHRQGHQPPSSGSSLEPHGRDGVRQFAEFGALPLEGGGDLPCVTLAYETYGTLNPAADNAVLVLHALTGDSHAASGATSEAGWWENVIGPGKAIDTKRFYVVVPSIIGGCGGSTGPAELAPDDQQWGSRFPEISLRDSVRSEMNLAQLLRIDRWYAVIGGSMGGARALEWAMIAPDMVERLVVLAACAASTPEQIALGHAQIEAIRLDSLFRSGDYYDAAPPHLGLGLARKIAHISYRSELELAQRFSVNLGAGEEHPVESYLQHQAQKLSARFDANSYLLLTQALMAHDVGRGRGGVSQALAQLTHPQATIAAVTSDRLYLPEQSRSMYELLGCPARYEEIDSQRGHDGFLTETNELYRVLEVALR